MGGVLPCVCVSIVSLFELLDGGVASAQNVNLVPLCPAGTAAVTKPRLDQISRAQGFDPLNSWASFEHLAIRTFRDMVSIQAPIRRVSSKAGIQYPDLLTPNTTPPGGPIAPRIQFQSKLRRDNTGGGKSWVAPDGVSYLKAAENGVEIEQHPNSVFFEAKALNGRTITLDYPPANFLDGDIDEPLLSKPSYQILGMIDVLSNSSAKRLSAKTSPALMFLTTADVRIGGDVTSRATNLGVAVWHSILCEYSSTQPISRLNPAKLQMSSLAPLNTAVYLVGGWSPQFSTPPRAGFLLDPKTPLQ
jgi:hypothetical protein